MAKQRLTKIAEDYELPFDEAKELAFKLLDEKHITGKGRNTWVDELGQKILDDNIPLKIEIFLSQRLLCCILSQNSFRSI